MKYIDYGTMQSEAQRRVLEMQRRAQRAVGAHPSQDAPPLPMKKTDCSARPHGAQYRPQEHRSQEAWQPEHKPQQPWPPPPPNWEPPEHWEPQTPPGCGQEAAPPQEVCGCCPEASECVCAEPAGLSRDGASCAAREAKADPELALLLAVLLLLVSEKADTVLILAVIYLMM